MSKDAVQLPNWNNFPSLVGTVSSLPETKTRHRNVSLTPASQEQVKGWESELMDRKEEIQRQNRASSSSWRMRWWWWITSWRLVVVIVSSERTDSRQVERHNFRNFTSLFHHRISCTYFTVSRPVSIQTQSQTKTARNASACVSCGFRLRNVRNASDCVWMETGLQSCDISTNSNTVSGLLQTSHNNNCFFFTAASLLTCS